MKQSDLFRLYANCIDLCEGTNIKPYKCIKNKAGQTYQNTPNFLGNPEDYKFAVAIVDNRPVFTIEVSK
jgi:hypothetical protein